MRWDYPTSQEKREELAAHARRSSLAGAIGIYADTTPKAAEGISPTMRVGGDGGSNLAVAFAQNTRDELRIQGDGSISGALAAQPGMKQTTYICMASGQLNSVENAQSNVSPTLTTLHEAPIVVGNTTAHAGISEDVTSTLTSTGGGRIPRE